MIPKQWNWIAILAMAGLSTACAKESEVIGPQFAERPPNCDVELFHGAPSGPTSNIGTVQVRCAEDISKEDCVRTLKDQVCKLGGDVVWEVPTEPILRNGKLEWSGRAAHTK